MRKNDSNGVFAAMGRAVDHSLKIASSIRAGTLTRRQFDAWYEQRRAQGAGLVVSLREKASDMAEPLGTMITRGEELLGAAAPRAEKHPARRRRTPRAAAKDASRNVARKAKPR